MNLKKYSSFFHDGSIIAINHVGNKATIAMESAELDESDIQDDVVLSKDDRIRGKLHIEQIKSLFINNKISLDILRKLSDEGGIVNFEITKNSVVLSIDWVNFPPKSKINDFSLIKIEAEKIWWENIPGLEIAY